MIARLRCIGPGRAAAALVAVMAAAATANVASAQDLRGRSDQPEQLPRELVDLLVARSGYGAAPRDYRIGEVPPSLPGGAAFSRETRIVGSVLRHERTNTGFAVAGSAGEARERFERIAEEAGWAAKPTPLPQRGFVPALSADPARGFCWPADDGQLSIMTYPAPGDSSYVVLQHYLPGGGRFCSAPPE